MSNSNSRSTRLETSVFLLERRRDRFWHLNHDPQVERYYKLKPEWFGLKIIEDDFLNVLKFSKLYLEDHEQEQQNSLQTEKCAKAEIWTLWKVTKFQRMFLFSSFPLKFRHSEKHTKFDKIYH